MPTIRPYLSRENAYTSGIQSRATPAAFGADIGAGLEGFGGAIAGMAPILKQKANEADADQAAAAVSTYDYTKPMIEQRQAAGLNPTGLADAVKEWHPDSIKTWLDGRNLSPAAYRRAYRQLMSQQPSIIAQQRNYEIQQTDANGQRLANEGINAIQNQIFSNPDAYDDLIPKMDQQIDLQRGVDASQREAMKVAGHQRLAYDRFKTKISDADTVEGLNAIEKELNSDPWTQRVDVKDHEQLNNVIKVQKNGIQTQADSEALAAVNNLDGRVDKGIMPPPEELQAVQALATKSGNISITNKLSVIQRKIDTHNTWNNQPTGRVQQEMDDRVAAANRPTRGSVVEAQAGHTRDLPLASETRGYLQRAAAATGLKVVVTSGGQPVSGPHRTGKHRHDLGGAGDVELHDAATDRRLNMNDPNDQPAFAQFVEEAVAAGATGVGAGRGYMGDFTIHVGGGAPVTAWGEGGLSKNAPQWLRDAFERGRARSGNKVIVPPRYDSSAQRVYTGMRSRFAGHVGSGDGSIQAAVMAGNIQQESSFRSWITSDNKHYGFVQWADQRFDNVKASASKAGKDWQDPEVQMDFIMEEGISGKGLTTEQKAGFDQFLNATTMEEANAGLKKYIGYGEDGTEATRLAYSKRIMNGYDVTASGETTSEPGSPAGMTEMEYAEQQALQSVIDHHNKLIADGNMMMLWSTQSGRPLADIQQPGGLALRSQQYQQAAAYNGVPLEEGQPFTAEEQRVLTKMVKDGTADDLVAILGEIQDMGPQVATAAANQFGKIDPVFSYGAKLYNAGNEQAGADVARGMKTIQSYKGDMFGTEGDYANMRSDFNTALGSSSITDQARRDQIFQAAKAHMAQTWYNSPNGVAGVYANSEGAKKAFLKSVQAVMSTVPGMDGYGPVNDVPTVLPRGVTASQMDGAVNNLTDADLASLSVDGNPPIYLPSGLPVPAKDVSDQMHFTQSADDTYRLVDSDGNFLATGVDSDGAVYFYNIKLDKQAIDAINGRTAAEQVEYERRSLPMQEVPPVGPEEAIQPVGPSIAVLAPENTPVAAPEATRPVPGSDVEAAPEAIRPVPGSDVEAAPELLPPIPVGY